MRPLMLIGLGMLLLAGSPGRSAGILCTAGGLQAFCTMLGFDPEELPVMFKAPELSVTRWGTLRVDHKTMQTNVEGVFAAGDIVRGASLVVWAIRDGRDVADRMHAFLKAKAKVVQSEKVAA